MGPMPLYYYMLALKSRGISIHCHQFTNSPQRCEVSHWNPSNLRRSPERWRSFRPSDLFKKHSKEFLPQTIQILWSIYYFYCIVLIHYAGISWGIDVYNICMCIYTYLDVTLYQRMIYYTSSFRSATVGLHNLLSSFKTIPTVAPRLLSINSRAG